MARRYKARDRTVNKMSRDGLVEENLNSKETRRVSRRDRDNVLTANTDSAESDYRYAGDKAGYGRKKHRNRHIQAESGFGGRGQNTYVQGDEEVLPLTEPSQGLSPDSRWTALHQNHPSEDASHKTLRHSTAETAYIDQRYLVEAAAYTERLYSSGNISYEDQLYPPERAAYSDRQYPAGEIQYTEQRYPTSDFAHRDPTSSAEKSRLKRKKARNKAAVYASYAKESERIELKADDSETEPSSHEPETAETIETAADFNVSDGAVARHVSPEPVIVEERPLSYEHSKRSEKFRNKTRTRDSRTSTIRIRKNKTSQRTLRGDRHRSEKLDYSQNWQPSSKLVVVSGKNNVFRRYAPTYGSNLDSDDTDGSQTDDTVQEIYGTAIKTGGDAIRIAAASRTTSQRRRRRLREEPLKHADDAEKVFARNKASGKTHNVLHERKDKPFFHQANVDSSGKKAHGRLHGRRRAEKTAEPDACFEGKKARNRKIQKKLRKRKYQKAYREAFLAGTGIFSPTGWKGFTPSIGKHTATKGASKSLVSMIAVGLRKNKAAAVAIILICLVLFMSILCFTGMIFEGGLAAIAATTYQSTDEDIHDVEDAYKELENALDEQINGIETTHPGYDEYRYQVDEISHNPFHLISYLTVLFGEFILEDVQTTLEEMFEAQYTLTVWEEVKTRTRTVTDPDTGEESEEEYDYYILNISLTNRGINAVAKDTLTEEQYKLYEVYNTTLGNRPELFEQSTLPMDINPESGYFYDIPPEALSDEKFARMYEEASKYLGYPYVWGGSSPQTSFDCSGFVSWVINHSDNGWSVGRPSAEGLRVLCAPVNVDEAKPGDLIFFQGTYNTSGASHVGIVVGDGKMIHCGDPIQVTSYLTPYWQQHFYQIGRLP